MSMRVNPYMATSHISPGRIDAIISSLMIMGAARFGIMAVLMTTSTWGNRRSSTKVSCSWSNNCQAFGKTRA
eukprot:2512729-Amphidinium_carterae.2